MVCVIADDITGAAEMAGIAHRLGLTVSLSLDDSIDRGCDVSVIATDTRSMTEREAVAETKRVVNSLMAGGVIDWFFKKTDSALRGHVVAELETLLQLTGYEGALYIPANPSKGRIIRGGVYYIKDVPISETDFSYDPEFPAFSSNLSERFPMTTGCGIQFADAVDGEDIRSEVNRARCQNLLLAGAADLFEAFLKSMFSGVTENEKEHHDVKEGSCVIVCGSTQSDPGQCCIEPSYMPTDLYDGTVSADVWSDELLQKYREKSHRILIAVKDRHRTGRGVAVHLRETMSEVVKKLVSEYQPENLIIEGGATAFSILSGLGWDAYQIRNEIAPGVISMQAECGVTVTMKPGSYPWGSLFS